MDTQSTAAENAPLQAAEPPSGEDALKLETRQSAEEKAADEQPAAGEQPAAAAEAAPAAEAGDPVGIQEAPAAPTSERAAEGPASPDESATQLPVITWSDPNAPPMDTGALGKGGAGGYAPFPGPAGMGGGDGGDGFAPGSTGVEAGLPGGGLILPLEAASSIEGAAVEEESAQEAPQGQAAPAEPAGNVTGGGPVLGLPPAEEAGQIEIQSAFGEPLIYGDQSPAAPEQEPIVREGSQDGDLAPPVGQVSIRTIQGLLAGLAVLTGAAAFFARRKRA
jgi:hypothetical protein